MAYINFTKKIIKTWLSGIKAINKGSNGIVILSEFFECDNPELASKIFLEGYREWREDYLKYIVDYFNKR